MNENGKMKLIDIAEIYNSLTVLGQRDDLDDIWWDLGENINILKEYNREYTDRKREIQNKFGERDKKGKLVTVVRNNMEQVEYGKNREKSDEMTSKLNDTVKDNIKFVTIPISALKEDGKFKVNIHPAVIAPLQGTIFVKDEKGESKKEDSKK